MELDKEFIESVGLDENQVRATTEFFSTKLADAKLEIENQYKDTANKNAEGIINGAIEPIVKATGIQRNEGEKAADFLTRVGSSYLSEKQSELDKVKADYEQKIKGVQGSETLAKEYEAMKLKHDEVLKKYADYDEIREKAEKADEYGQQLSGLKLEVSFGKVRPNFPESVNPFEADAKWNAFKKSVLEKNTIELVEGEAIAIDKENPHKTTKLKDLVEKDTELSELLKGRQQGGLGAKEADKVTIDGVPFEVPKNAGAKERATAIREYLTKQGIDPISDQWTLEFAKYNKAITSKQ